MLFNSLFQGGAVVDENGRFNIEFTTDTFIEIFKLICNMCCNVSITNSIIAPATVAGR